jgi:hypothetical protein
MSRIHSERLMHWAAAALFALSMHSLFAPRTAFAGCNHLVVSKSDRVLNLNRFDLLIIGDSSLLTVGTFADDPLKSQHPERPAPCSGPACSSRVPLPAPSASYSPDGSDQWVFQNAVLAVATASPPCGTIDELAAHAAAEGFSIFRPPPV